MKQQLLPYSSCTCGSRNSQVCQQDIGADVRSTENVQLRTGIQRKQRVPRQGRDTGHCLEASHMCSQTPIAPVRQSKPELPRESCSSRAVSPAPAKHTVTAQRLLTQQPLYIRMSANSRESCSGPCLHLERIPVRLLEHKRWFQTSGLSIPSCVPRTSVPDGS